MGNKVPWTEVKSQNRMTRAVVNSGKCETRKNPADKTAGPKPHVKRGPRADLDLGLSFFFFFCGFSSESFCELRRNQERFVKRDPFDGFSGS